MFKPLHYLIAGGIQGLFVLCWFGHLRDNCTIYVNLTKAHRGYSFCAPGTPSWGWRHRTYGTLVIITRL